MRDSLAPIINGYDCSGLVNAYSLQCEIEEREGENGGLLRDGTEVKDILARKIRLSWTMNTVSAALNANTADNTLRLKRHLEEFRNSSLALDMNISVGDITVTHADGHRSYGLRGQKPSLDICGKTIDEILENITCQDDYFSVLDQVLEVFTKHAKQKVREAIEWYADAKDLYEAEKADDAVARDSIASEYVIWYQRIHEFLRDNPKICREIEEKSGTTGLVDFFKMQNRE